MSFIQTNPVFQAVTNANISQLNNAIIQGHKINDTENENTINVLEYAILTLKYSMVKPILVYVNLLLPSEKSKMLNSSLKVLVKCMDKYVNMNSDEDLTDDLIVFNELKNSGADLSIVINESEEYYLYHYAIKFNSQALFDILIDANVDSNVYDVHGNDVLIFAFLYSRDNFIPTLISKSNNLNITQRYSQKSLLHLAVERDSYDAAVQLLSLSPSLLSAKDDNGKTALHYVTIMYNKETAHKYIDCFSTIINLNSGCGDVINAQDGYGNTALHYAISKNVGSDNICNCMIKSLVNKGASLYIANKQNVMPIDMCGLSRSLIGEIC